MRAESEQAFEEGGELKASEQSTSRKRVMGTTGLQRYMERSREAQTTPMSKGELRAYQGQLDPEELEAQAIERSYKSQGVGGRIETYANGAMEWVPNGPGDVPQPPTGDIFYDPIKEAQREMDMKAMLQKLRGRIQKNPSASLEDLTKKFARGGVVKKFQNGGLAEVALPPDPDEDDIFDPSQATGVDEILSSVMPDPAPDLHKMARMTRDTALEHLRAGQTEFQERKARQNKRAEQDRWFALAQGMLAPTQTGGFGESVGTAAGALRAQSAQQTEMESLHAAEEQRFAEREADVASDYFDSLSNLEGFKNSSRARVVGSITVVAPRHRAAVESGEMKEEDADRVWANAIMQPDGTVVTSIAGDQDGNPYRVVDPKKDPQQAAAQKSAEAGAAAGIAQQFDHARQGLQAIPMVRRYQKAYGLLSTLDEDTSGLNEKMRQVAQWAGISEVIDDNVDLARLHGMFGKQVLQDLRLLTGTKTDFEFQQVERMNARLGASVDENLGLIDDQLRVLGTMVDKGEFAAQEISEGPGIESREFMLDEYLRFRKSQADAAIEYDEMTRTAPASKEEQLLELFQGATGDEEEQAFLIEAFEEHFDLTDEVRLALRAMGAGV